MKKIKLNLKEDFVSLKNNGKNFKNPLLKQASISISKEEVCQTGGVGFTQHSKTYAQIHSKTTTSIVV